MCRECHEKIKRNAELDGLPSLPPGEENWVSLEREIERRRLKLEREQYRKAQKRQGSS